MIEWDMAIFLIMVAAACILVILLWTLKIHLEKTTTILLLVFVILSSAYAAVYFGIKEEYLMWALGLYILLIFIYLIIVKVLYPTWRFIHVY